MKRSTIALTIEDFGKTAVDIGRLAENKAVQVRVDLSKILLQEPKATASLVVESPSGDKYPAITRMEGKTLIWDVAAADVASAGKGKVQLNVIGTNGEVLKSAVAVIRISGSIVGNGQAPNPVQNWIDSATKALNEAYAIVAELQQKLDDGEFVGPQGDPGATGATPNIQIGSVETGNPGTDAEASMSGTPEAPILNLKIPRGADGSGSVSKVDGVWPASGNVPLGAVRYSAAQNLTEAQQAQARENINAAKNAAMTGATESAAGAGGLVPAPAAGDQEKVLHGNGTWKKIDLSGKTVEITATELTGKNTADRAAMYAAGTRLLKVVNGDTEVLLGLDADGNTEWLGSNKPLNNLLDNSNFSNAVNQRGQSSYTASSYTIDRWAINTWSGNPLAINSGYIAIGEDVDTKQYLSDTTMGGKTYTCAAKILNQAIPLCGSGTMPTENGGIVKVKIEGGFELRLQKFDNGYCGVDLFAQPGNTINVEWAALYEGAYTADTLPPYTPKGYAAELAECQRYYWQKTFIQYETISLGFEGKEYGFIQLSAPREMRIREISFSQSAAIQCGNATHIYTGAKCIGTEIIAAHNYTQMSNPAYSSYAYCPSGQVTLAFSADL